ncbi:hypothetical protein H6P81_019349 [Aristolochia fimbriata]|uniref:F-box domain-containing protein n=1 Tax=Aristolochia fimbriata TaxID=158543 RepID=A0AAV7DSC1_ARIFI|nr:hypothetical protein H6P81_019349 [Aristolochia fimbriata]
MIQHNKQNKDELHITSLESLDGEQTEEKLKFVVPDLLDDRIKTDTSSSQLVRAPSPQNSKGHKVGQTGGEFTGMCGNSVCQYEAAMLAFVNRIGSGQHFYLPFVFPKPDGTGCFNQAFAWFDLDRTAAFPRSPSRRYFYLLLLLQESKLFSAVSVGHLLRGPPLCLGKSVIFISPVILEWCSRDLNQVMEDPQISETLSQMEEMLQRMQEDLLKYKRMIDQMKVKLHKDKRVVHQIDHNGEKLHKTPLEPLEGEQMEEKLKCMVSNTREDGINSLPETVLLHILSYLPTKDSIRTSMVGKRWRYLWKAVPSLNVDILLNSDRNCEKILDFVDEVLVRRDDSALPEFRLSYHELGRSGTSFVCRFKFWIKAIARLKPKLLHLNLYSQLSSLLLPTMETLEMLTLRVRSQTVNLQSLSMLHHLKILKLERVDFCLGELSDLPSLEEIHLRSGRFVGDSVSDISLPSLRIFSVQYYSVNDGDLKISAPRLVSFSLDGRNIFAFDKFSSLSKLVMSDSSSDSSCIDRLSKIMAGISVNIFFWRCSYVMWSTVVEGLRACMATPFVNLKLLCLPFFCCNCDDYVESVAYLLQSCPKLEKLVIAGFGVRESSKHGENKCLPTKDPPKFTLSCLREMEVAYNRKDNLQQGLILNDGVLVGLFSTRQGHYLGIDFSQDNLKDCHRDLDSRNPKALCKLFLALVFDSVTWFQLLLPMSSTFVWGSIAATVTFP